MKLTEYLKWFYNEEQENGVNVRIYEDIRFPNHNDKEASEVEIWNLNDK